MFAYTALDGRGQRLSETLEAASLGEAQRELLRRGLFILNVEPQRDRKAAALGPLAQALGWTANRRVVPAARGGELALFARQLAMMLRAGTSLVPAIRAVREQPGRPAWHALLDDLAERLEGGAGLHEAMSAHPRIFSGASRSIVAAGEATGALSEAFLRLTVLLEARQRLRKRVLGALIYPAMLLTMAVGVVATMVSFVLPRFAQLFEQLDAPLPALTRGILSASALLKPWWPVVLAAPVGLTMAAVWWLRSPFGRRVGGRLALRIPLLGRALAGVLLARLLQTWATLLHSHVALLDAVRQARNITSNVVFQRLITDIELAITEGRAMSAVLKQAKFVPPPVVSVIATGEESGRLAESLEFVGGWMEEQNEALIGAITRLCEPAILVLMGLVVGFIAIALFLPLFDIATAAR